MQVKWSPLTLKTGRWWKFCLNARVMYGRHTDLHDDVDKIKAVIGSEDTRWMVHPKDWTEHVTVAVEGEIDCMMIALIVGPSAYRGIWLDGKWIPKTRVNQPILVDA